MQILTPLLTLQNQLRIFHWQTKSYAEHKALGKAYEGLDSLIDDFVEVYFGKYGNINAKDSFKINLENYSAKDCREVVQDGINYLENLTNEMKENDTELLNIRDEMLAVLERTKYLLRLT
jgi:DNA-binding ferritin-like protein